MAGKLRITGGALVRRLFNVPKAADKGLVRPTPDRVREALFSSLAPYLPGARVLDLFAGSGASSFEAISRGAESALLVELERETAHCIQGNIQALGLSNQCQLVVGDALRFVEQRKEQQYDIVFVDPPYPLAISASFWHFLKACVDEKGIVVYRNDKKTPFLVPEHFSVLREKVYAGTRVFFLILS